MWAGSLAGLGAIYFVFGRRPLPADLPPDQTLTGLVGLVPLFVSVILRWLLLPRLTKERAAFGWFILGLALAEACGLLGIFIGGPYRDDIFVLGMLGLAQWVPLFVRRYCAPFTNGSGFRPGRPL